MNKTSHGRWGRLRMIKGEQHKLCNGPLHADEGAWLPMRSFWVIKSGARAGKPFSRCIACERAYRNRDPATSGLVEVDRVMFIFEEIKRRIGKAEACRRLDASPNLWMRLERRIYTKMYRRTVRDAMLLLRELRDNDVVISRNSIRHGALARGRTANKPKDSRDFYVPATDEEAANKRTKRKVDPTQTKRETEYRRQRREKTKLTTG